MDSPSTLETKTAGKAPDVTSAPVPATPAPPAPMPGASANDAGAAGTPADGKAAGGTAASGGAGQKSGTGPAAEVQLTIGAKDPNGNEVKCIYAKTDRYVIYLAGGRVRFHPVSCERRVAANLPHTSARSHPCGLAATRRFRLRAC